LGGLPSHQKGRFAVAGVRGIQYALELKGEELLRTWPAEQGSQYCPAEAFQEFGE
jgi:hypothetical protein